MATVWQETRPAERVAPRKRTLRWWKSPLARRLFVAFWLLLPLAVVWWHYGPGQPYLESDTAADFTRRGAAAVAESDWEQAVDQYDLALATLPTSALSERRKLEVAQAAARVQMGEILEGQEQLQKLIEELEVDSAASEETLAAARHELGAASYYAAWVMRLEGASREEWLPETERARQQFRLLAEVSTEDGDPAEETRPFQENLEAAIRLEQMDLATLRALPPPCDGCCNCRNLSQRKREQCRSRCNNPGDNQSEKEQEPRDARQQVQQTRRAGIQAGGGGGS